MLLRTLALPKLFYEPANLVQKRTTARLPLRGKWMGKVSSIPLQRGVSTPNCKILTDTLDDGDVLELGGWYTGDGCVGKTAKSRTVVSEVTIYEPVTGKFRQKLEQLLNKMNISFDNRKTSIRFRSEELARFLSTNFGTNAHMKTIPQWLQLLPTELLQRFWNGLMQADGQFFNGLPKAFDTVSKSLADQFLILTLKIGLSGRISEKKEKTSFIKGRPVTCSKSYKIIFRKNNFAFTYTANKTGGYRVTPKIEDYTGKVWCFEIRKNHNFAVSRNGRFVFCGNSHPTSWHVGESIPFWLDEQREATKELGVVVREFGYDIKEHLKLITGAQEFVKEVYEEAKEWRQERKLSQLKQIKRMGKQVEAPSQKSIVNWF